MTRMSMVIYIQYQVQALHHQSVMYNNAFAIGTADAERLKRYKIFIKRVIKKLTNTFPLQDCA